MRSITTLVKLAFHEPVSQEPSQQFVFRVAEASAVKDTWLRRIIELADGKSVEEISQALYLEEVRAGAWDADIGFWRTTFCREVARTIAKLVSQGCVRIEGPPMTDRDERKQKQPKSPLEEGSGMIGIKTGAACGKPYRPGGDPPPPA